MNDLTTGPSQFSDGKRYHDYRSFIKQRFSERVQKIAVSGDFSCPNRDGSRGVGGCTYCNNKAFSPNDKGREQSITQ